MNQQTPRKGRSGGRRNQQGRAQAAAVVSDIESEDNTTGADGSLVPAAGGFDAGADRGFDLTILNLHVLRRYEPSIRRIVSVAASTVVYVVNYETGGWEKPEPPVEGTLFLCEQEPLVFGNVQLPRACVFLLNRKGLMNVVVDLARVNVAEATPELITLRIDTGAQDDESGNDADTAPVLGFWIHGGGNGAREVANAVLACWQDIRRALMATLSTASVAQTGLILEAAETTAAANMAAAGQDPIGMATRAIGHRPDIRDLVASALGQNPATSSMPA